MKSVVPQGNMPTAQDVSPWQKRNSLLAPSMRYMDVNKTRAHPSAGRYGVRALLFDMKVASRPLQAVHELQRQMTLSLVFGTRGILCRHAGVLARCFPTTWPPRRAWFKWDPQGSLSSRPSARWRTLTV